MGAGKGVEVCIRTSELGRLPAGSTKKRKSQALTVKKEDLEGTQKELDAALAYFDKLKPSCVDASAPAPSPCLGPTSLLR